MYEFEVANLSCAHCVNAVTHAIHREDPAAVVEVDLAARQLRVQSRCDEARLREALARVDYPVS